MFVFINEIFIGLLASVANTSNHIKYLSVNNQKSEIQPTLINYSY